jgi:hypothetical protein
MEARFFVVHGPETDVAMRHKGCKLRNKLHIDRAKRGSMPETPLICRHLRAFLRMGILDRGAWSRAFVMACALPPTVSAAQDWSQVASNDAYSLSMRVEASVEPALAHVRLQVRVVYRKPRDMMGLVFDSTITDYLLSCASSEMLRKQQMLFDGDERVWMFPVSMSVVKAVTEIAPEVERKACAEHYRELPPIGHQAADVFNP